MQIQSSFEKYKMVFMAILVVLVVGGFVYYLLPGFIAWIIEVLGYPFWVVYTKIFHFQIDQFDSFWGTIGIWLLSAFIFGNFKPVRIKQVTVKSKIKTKPESEESE